MAKAVHRKQQQEEGNGSAACLPLCTAAARPKRDGKSRAGQGNVSACFELQWAEAAVQCHSLLVLIHSRKEEAARTSESLNCLAVGKGMGFAEDDAAIVEARSRSLLCSVHCIC